MNSRKSWADRGIVVLAILGFVAIGCGGGDPPIDVETAAIAFETVDVPAGGAGQFYNAEIRFASFGGAALPDRFNVEGGQLPAGIQLLVDREDLDGDGLPDEDGAPTGHARLVGFPRGPGSYGFSIKAISTGANGDNPEQPTVATTKAFVIDIGEGSITVLTPTAEQGTSDSAVPAFPDNIDFVNPANPQAFFSWAFLIAGGSGSNLLNVYLPRELELSVFDANVANGLDELSFDTDEGPGSGSKFLPHFSDGGWFVLQAGNSKVQVGGFQSPRGPVGTIDAYADGDGLDPDWFQSDAVMVNSRRDLGDSQDLAGGDDTLGTALPVQFCDYFDPAFERTWPDGPSAPLCKYPFQADQYSNAFFVTFTPGVDLTPLRYRAIVEAIDTRGTLGRSDDVIDRKAYVVNVRIPDIVIDTVILAGGQAGIEYTEYVNASGGVPPLRFDFEWVDGVPDFKVTEGDDLTKDDFGIEMDGDSGQFFGVPRASGLVELTVCVYADVMNPTQSGPGYLPTGTVGEFAGLHPVTGTAGVHKTFPVGFEEPTAPTVSNASFAPGIDGAGYPGDRVLGAGGVPLMVPYPVGFQGTYPSSSARRAYGWDATYVRDASWGPDAGTVDPDRALPNNLRLDGDIKSTTNGQISGIPYDRGFHPVTIIQTDAYIGTATSPDTDAYRQVSTKTFALSISPDTATYLRGAPSAVGGTPSGLLDGSNAMGESLMVPLFLESAFFSIETGKPPLLYPGSAVPKGVDILPVMLPNGGSDSHVEKGMPSISGFWPAESNKNPRWFYYYYGAAESSWKHLQQEHVWLQTPREDQARVFLWAETRVKSYSSGATSGYNSKRYQQYDSNGKRGVMVMNPLTGDYWFPAVLDNRTGDADGSQFGAECVLGSGGYYPNYYDYWPYLYDNPWRYYSYGYMIYGDREVQLQGMGSYLESYENSYTGRAAQGRTATSVAMSADGVWCATAMPGGSGPLFLLWRNDRQPIPASVLAQSFVSGVNGLDANGQTMSNSACIVNLGAQFASGGGYIPNNQRVLFPDSLMFVRDGLIFLIENELDYVFGFSLVDGHLSSRYVNSRSTPNGYGRTAYSWDGQFAPDQDYVRGQKCALHFMAQFSWLGSKPADGEEGPDKIAFTAGDLWYFFVLDNYSGFPRLSSQVRSGYGIAGKYNRSLLSMDCPTSSGGGLDLSGSTLVDLTGNSSYLYGNLLTPGRPGEEMDYMAMSPDGEYVAIVRDIQASGTYSYYYYGYGPMYATLTTSGAYASYYIATEDLILCSTSGKDLDTASGTQTVLFLGTGNYQSNYSGTPNANSASYCSAKPWINAMGRRIDGLRFTPDSKTLLFEYAADNTYWPTYYGGSNQYAINAEPSQYYLYAGLSAQASLRWHFRTSTDGAINFGSSSAASGFLKNNLDGLNESGINAVGPKSPPFGSVNGNCDMQFWATFASENGDFLYYVVDQISGRNFLVGFNMSDSAIGGHAPFEPFLLHGSTVGFEQFDGNAWNYENRFFAVPAGTVYEPSGRDGAGIVFVIGSDASAGATSATDLEVYAFDANVGGDLVNLTSAITDGSANAINHLYASADGNVLVGQRCKTTASSNSGRAKLNGDNDLFAVKNVHAALGGAAPNAVIVSAEKSHGATVAFVGDGTPTGPQAVIYSSADKGGNSTWDDRTLKIGVLESNTTPSVLDSTASHYAVLAGGRKLDDDPFSSD